MAFDPLFFYFRQISKNTGLRNRFTFHLQLKSITKRRKKEMHAFKRFVLCSFPYRAHFYFLFIQFMEPVF